MINPLENSMLIGVVLIVTAIAAGFDIAKHKIPNILNFMAMAVALGYFSAIYGWNGFLFSAKGLVTGVALLLVPYLMGGMGAGDAKLMGAVGAFLGMEKIIVAFLFIACMGCVYALFVLIVQRNRMRGYYGQLWLTAKAFILTRQYIPVESSAESRPKVYYGIAIAAGTLLYVSAELSGLQTLI